MIWPGSEARVTCKQGQMYICVFLCIFQMNQTTIIQSIKSNVYMGGSSYILEEGCQLKKVGKHLGMNRWPQFRDII
jgi:hypothetical protein